MGHILFLDIPSVPKAWKEDVKDVLSLKYAAQDVLYAKQGLGYPYQRKRLQFTRGFLTMSSYLKEHGHTTDYVNCNDETYKDRVVSLPEGSFIGVPSITAFMPIVKEICENIKRLNPKINIVIGGYHASARPNETMIEIPEIDFLISGEGEKPTLNLLTGNIQSKGISRKVNGKPNINIESDFLFEEQIPNPDYSILSNDLNKYNFNVQTVRGCSYRCNFCVNGFFWKRERATNLKRVKQELDFLSKNLEPNTFMHFSDNDFLWDKKRAFAISEYILKEGMQFNLSCDTRADSIDTNVVKMMEHAGFKRIYIGFEEGNHSVLNTTKKGITLEDSIAAAKLIKFVAPNMIVEAYWMNGLPGSTFETIEQNLSLAEKLLDEGIVDFISGSTIFTPLPGSPFFDNPSKYGIIIKNKEWDNYIRDNFYPAYCYEGLSQNDLYSAFLEFEKMLTENYTKRLGMSPEQIAKIHKVVVSTKPEDIDWRKIEIVK